MSPYISGFLIFLIISLFLGAFFSLLYTDKLKLNDESLDKQPLFWFAVLSPIVLFLVFGVVIWKDYIPDLSKAGLDKFAEISKFPLAVLALSPIFGVIVSNIHRTIQTEKQILSTERQIAIAEEKNLPDSFYAHKKYVTEEFTKTKFKINLDIDDITILSPNKLYSKIFEKSNIKNGMNDEVSDLYLSITKDSLLWFITNVKETASILEDNDFKFNLESNELFICFISNACKILHNIVNLNEINPLAVLTLEMKIHELKETGYEIENSEEQRKNSNLLNLISKNSKNKRYLKIATEVFNNTKNMIEFIYHMYSGIFDIINMKKTDELNKIYGETMSEIYIVLKKLDVPIKIRKLNDD
ncbi:hypothetical protein AAA733_002258 [Providencia rettgeri]